MTTSKTPLLDTIQTPQDLRKLKPADLKQVADELRHETIDAVSVTGGHLGALRKGSLDPGFEEVAFGLPDGGIGGPVRSAFGFHVIKAFARKQLPTPPLDEVKSELQRELMEKRQREEVAKWVQELKKKAFIDVRL